MLFLGALNTEPRFIEAVVEAIAFLFAESSRLNITDQEFVDSFAINGVDFDSDLIGRLKEVSGWYFGMDSYFK